MKELKLYTNAIVRMEGLDKYVLCATPWHAYAQIPYFHSYRVSYHTHHTTRHTERHSYLRTLQEQAICLSPYICTHIDTQAHIHTRPLSHRNKQLQSLILQSNKITQINGIQHLGLLSVLRLDSNEVAIIENLYNNRALTLLNLSHNKIQKIEVKGIAVCCPCVPLLSLLTLSCHSLSFLFSVSSLSSLLSPFLPFSDLLFSFLPPLTRFRSLPTGT